MKAPSRLTVIGDAPKTGHHSRVVAVCECGTVKTYIKHRVLSGYIRSCGCLVREAQRAAVTTHGMSYTREYRSWSQAKSRCNDTNHHAWPSYGGRGIKMCADWAENFSKFLADMGSRPPGMSLDRIDPNGNYEPGNCRWATATQQNRNKRTSKLTQELVDMIRASDRSGAELARQIGCSKNLVNTVRAGKAWAA